MVDIEQQKLKLEQKKNRLAAEELKLRFKERKARTRNLIELGGLVVKAGLDTLPINALYGGLLSLKDALEKDDAIQAIWVVKGNATFNQEQQEKVAIILKFEKETKDNVRELLREHGLMWNKFREEWYGYTTDLDSLKEGLGDIPYNLEIIS